MAVNARAEPAVLVAARTNAAKGDAAGPETQPDVAITVWPKASNCQTRLGYTGAAGFAAVADAAGLVAFGSNADSVINAVEPITADFGA